MLGGPREQSEQSFSPLKRALPPPLSSFKYMVFVRDDTDIDFWKKYVNSASFFSTPSLPPETSRYKKRFFIIVCLLIFASLGAHMQTLTYHTLPPPPPKFSPSYFQIGTFWNRAPCVLRHNLSLSHCMIDRVEQLNILYIWIKHKLRCYVVVIPL